MFRKFLTVVFLVCFLTLDVSAEPDYAALRQRAEKSEQLYIVVVGSVNHAQVDVDALKRYRSPKAAFYMLYNNRLSEDHFHKTTFAVKEKEVRSNLQFMFMMNGMDEPTAYKYSLTIELSKGVLYFMPWVDGDAYYFVVPENFPG
jgi:hypothetical protein